jgi:hypothetical protein
MFVTAVEHCKWVALGLWWLSLMYPHKPVHQRLWKRRGLISLEDIHRREKEEEEIEHD